MKTEMKMKGNFLGKKMIKKNKKCKKILEIFAILRVFFKLGKS